MSSADFAAAQARLHARRQQREAEYRARIQAQREALNTANISRLPYPLNRVGTAGLSIWEGIRGREGTRPAFRVGQVDAELLDEELLELLKGQVGEGLKYFGNHLASDYSSEILLALRAILFKLSIWDHNASYGAALQGLRYTDTRSDDPARPPPKRWQKSAYGLLTVGGRYAWTKWEEWLSARTSDYELPSARVRLAERLTDYLSTTHSFAAFISFLVFLTNGRYRTLVDRLLGLRLTPASSSISREVSFEYLNRQLVWHAFTEFLLFLLPLVGISRWRRILARSWRKIKTFFSRSSAGADDDSDAGKAGELGFLPERTCAICYNDQNPTGGTASESQMMAQSAASGGVVGSTATDVTNPYQAIPCGCVYCFVCLAQKIEAEEGEGWTCLRCGELVKSCRPWDGDVLVDHGRPTSSSGSGGKSVGFAADANLDADEKASLLQMDPAPVEDERDIDVSATIETLESVDGDSRSSFVEDSRRVGLGESEEWTRASRYMAGGAGRDSSDEDEQSEELDEEEEEMDYDD
ncbi:Pex12 amino terminal region-domain-containing protein [Phyllosticta citrichinensis]